MRTMTGSTKFGFFGRYSKFLMLFEMLLEFRFLCGNSERSWSHMFAAVEIYFVWDRLTGRRRGSKYGGLVGVGADLGGSYHVDLAGSTEFADNWAHSSDKLAKQGFVPHYYW